MKIYQIGERVSILSRRKKSQNWTKRGRIIAIEGFKALVEWDDYHRKGARGSWVELTQLSKVKLYKRYRSTWKN